MENSIGTNGRQIIEEQDKEAREEVRRILKEKKAGFVAGIFLFVIAFFRAAKCTNNYILAADEENTEPACSCVCTCGYHPSRREIRNRITEEMAVRDLRIIADKFSIAGTGNETRRSASILLEILDTAREQLKEQKLLRERYIDSMILSEKLPVLALDVIKYFCSGEISAEQADGALIEIKGRYQALFSEMGIIPAQAPAKKK